MLFILDPDPRKCEKKRRNNKIIWFVACHILKDLSKYIFIHISDIQNDIKYINMRLNRPTPVEITQVSRRSILSLLCLSRNVSGPKSMVK